MKRKKIPLSLLEVFIGLALTAILLTALFSSFNQMIQGNVKVQKVREDLHWTFVAHLRLNQIFETLEEKSLFFTAKHPEAKEEALYFHFDNRVDYQPEFSQKVEGMILRNKENHFCLYTLGAEGNWRREVFFKKAEAFSLSFFDPKEKKWVAQWEKKGSLPPFFRVFVAGKEFTFTIPKVARKVAY